MINLLPLKVTEKKSPFEILYNQKSEYDILQIFGCLVYYRNNETKGDKFDARGSPSIFVGYPRGIKEYKIYDTKTSKIIVSRDVKFVERTFSFSSINKEAEEEEEIFRFQKEWAILDETRKEINSPTEHMSGQGTNLLDQNDDPSQTISSSAQTEDIEGGGSPEQSNTTQARDTVPIE